MYGVFICRNAKQPGIDGAGGRGIQGCRHTFPEARLHGFRFRTGQQFQSRNTAADAVFQFPFQSGNRVLVVGHQQGTAAGKRHIQRFAKSIHIGVAPDSQLCLQTAGLVVVTGIANGRIGPGDAFADIVFLFKKQDRDVPPAQIPGGHTAQNTAADYDGIILFHISPGG